MAAATDTVYRFEAFELDLGMAELRKGGIGVPVEPQVFDLLALLIAAADRVVTRDEIIERIWDGRIVSESAISSRINAARKALGDDGTRQRAIRTVHGRGFRFALTPTSSDDAAPPPPAHKPAIAVLPFAVLSAGPEQEFFADGIAEDIIGALSRFHALSVIARNTSFTYRGQHVSVREVAETLGVNYVLEGSVRQAGNRVRVSVSLIDAGTEQPLWSDRYDRELDDVFSVQDEITAAAVTAILPQTDYAEMTKATRKDPAALSDWERVMRARWHLNKFSKQDTDTGLEMLEEAIARAPDLAIAHSAIAVGHCHRMLNSWADDPLEAIADAKAAATRAVELDAQDASALAVLGLAAMFARDFETCIERLDDAVATNPNLAAGYGFMATAYGCLGDFEKTSAAFERAIALSPKDPTRGFWTAGLGIALFLSRQYEACIENADRMMRAQPGYGPALRQKLVALQMLGRAEEAAEVLEDVFRAMPGLTVSRVRTMVPVSSDENLAHWLGALRAAGLPE